MIVESTCRKCGTHFDGHWHNLPPDVPSWETVFCPKCKSKDIHVTTDESNDKFYDEHWDERSEPPQEEESNED